MTLTFMMILEPTISSLDNESAKETSLSMRSRVSSLSFTIFYLPSQKLIDKEIPSDFNCFGSYGRRKAGKFSQDRAEANGL